MITIGRIRQIGRIGPTALLFFLNGLFAAGDRAVPADPFAGDPRMTIRRTIRVHDQAIVDFLADLNLQTGIRFFAEGVVADDRITVIARDRQLGETLHAIADLYRDEWKRTKDSGDRGYVLAQSAAQTETEDRAKLAKIREVVDVILLETRLFDRYANVHETQLTQRSAELAKQLDAAMDSARKRELQVEIGVVAQVLGHGDWRKLVNKFLRTLDRDSLVSIMTGAGVEYSDPPVPGAKEFSADVRKAFRGGMDPQPNLSGRDQEFVTLRLTPDARPDPVLRWEMTVGRRGDGGTRSLSFKSSLPSTVGLFQPERPDSVSPPVWETDPALSSPVSFKLLPLKPDKAQPDAVQKRRTLGEALDALDVLKPQDYIADAFYSTRIAGYEQTDRPLGEALDRLCQMTGHRWTQQNGFVVVRSMSFESDRRSEPPAAEIARWSQRAAERSLDLPDYAEMASLPDEKLGTLKMMGLRGDFPDTLQPIHQARDQLRLWNSLNRAQRRKAQAEGILFSELTVSQQRLMSLAAEESASKLQKAKLRVFIHQNRLWGAHIGDGPHFSTLSSRQEVLEQFKSIDPAIKERDVKSVVSDTVRFVFETPGGLLGQAYVSIPPRWLDSDSP